MNLKKPQFKIHLKPLFWTDPTNGKSDHPLAFKMKGTDKKLTNGKNIVKRRK
jgi:hypothetical protein